MKTNIVISPSQQSWNTCAMGDVEENHMHEIGKALYDILSADSRLNIYLIPLLGGNDTETLYAATDLSNEFIRANGGSGYHIALHSDGGYAGSGASGFYLSEGGKAFGRFIYEEICKLTPWGDMSFSQRQNLYELKYTDAIAFLLEISFHDQLEQAKWIHDNIDNIAQAIARGIYKGLGIEPIEPDWKAIVMDIKERLNRI